MPKNISHRELVKKLREFGFEGPRSGAKHQYMVQGEFRLRVPNPHKSDISKHLVAEILRQASISSKEWDNR
ncbi:MAG: type II toxin-antitoxin system HicA family toxin [Candidatus Paceibacterota bacterium]|jgi:predicted RNA binding protein YcfA (HicA-like mRNA interferase family)